MKRTISIVSITVFVLTVSAGVANAQHDHEHEGDFIIGISGGAAPQLKFEFDEHILQGLEHIELPPIDPPTAGVYEGWASDMPGFDHLHDAEPAEDFYPLGAGAVIRLVGVDLEPALYVRAPTLGSPVAISPTPTLGSLLLGDEELHSHAIWQVNALDSGFDPAQSLWQGTFRFVDTGATAYADSEPFTLTFAIVPEPASLVLLVFGGVAAATRRRRPIR